MNTLIDKNFWKGKKVLITGNTGFKGSWLSLWLHSIGAEVYGYSLPIDNSKLLYNLLKLESSVNQTFGDINDYDSLKKNIDKSKPDIIFHMAAQPLVRDSYINPIETIGILYSLHLTKTKLYSLLRLIMNLGQYFNAISSRSIFWIII